MKKILIIAAAVLMSATAFGQKKGDMYVGGGLTFGTSTTSSSYSVDGAGSSSNSSTTASFSITPSFGYFVMDNLKVGGSVDYAYSGSTNNFLIGPEASYYLRLADNFYYTPGLGLYGGVVAANGEAVGAFSFRLSLAQVEFRPFDKFAFTFDLMNMSYRVMSRSEAEARYSLGTFQFNLNLNASVGARYYF